MTDKITIADLIDFKRQGCKIAAVSCYDYTAAKMVAQANVEMVIVGDSAAQLVLGYDSTLPATMDFMTAITSAVRRGAPDVFLVADMPFLSYQAGIGEAIKNAGRFFVEANVQMVKIEVTEAHLGVIKEISDAGMAVMAHIGIRPQSVSKIGRFKAEATTAEMAVELINLAKQTVYAGAKSLLLEGTAAEVAEIITANVEVPVISCGSGANCDGQVLVLPDILGTTADASPKFAKSYAKLGDRTIKAVSEYSKEVKESKYPDAEHSYHMRKGEVEKLKNLLGFE